MQLRSPHGRTCCYERYYQDFLSSVLLTLKTCILIGFSLTSRILFPSIAIDKCSPGFAEGTVGVVTIHAWKAHYIDAPLSTSLSTTQQPQRSLRQARDNPVLCCCAHNKEQGYAAGKGRSCPGDDIVTSLSETPAREEMNSRPIL
jgi:hypothetical protein